MKVNKQTKLKLRLASLFAVVAMMMPQVIQFTQSAYMMNAWADVAAAKMATTYFYDQLKAGNEKKFYDTFMLMHEKGFLRQGDVSVKVTGLNYTPGEEQALLNEMGAARDAFWLDHADLFYIDFDQLSLKISNGEVYVGTGRSDTYINKEFLGDDGTVDEKKIKNAINAVNSRVDAIVKEADTKTSTKDKVRVAHDAVIKAAKYTLEFDTDHPYSVRTVYGVFGLGQANNAGNAVCEGYARALKMILDKMGIVSILVRGVYMENSKPQEHMWLYVQDDDGRWYAIDVTFDNGAEDKNKSDAEQHEYFWVGGDKMESHIETGVISTSNKEFEYPALEGDLSGAFTENTTAICSIDDDDYDSYEEAMNDPNSCISKQSKLVYEDAAGIRIEYADEEWIGGKNENPDDKDGATSTMSYHISYQGMGYKDAAKKGIYIILNGCQERRNDGTDNIDELCSGWTYPTEATNTYKQIYQDMGTYFKAKMEGYNTFRVGISNIGPTDDSMENAYGVFFEGDESDILTTSQELKTKREVTDYPQPFVKKTNPAHTRAQTVGKTYHIVVEYDQDMVLIDPDKPLDYELKLYDLVYGYRTPSQDEMKYEIKNIQLLDDKRTITYDFTPSKMWSLDETAYIVSFTNIKGIISGQAPNPVEYVLFNKTTTCIFQLHSLNADLEVYGKPTLMDDFDVTELLRNQNMSETLNPDQWLEYLQKYGDLLKNRLSLVVSDTTSKENDVLEDLLTNQLKEKEGNRPLDDKGDATHIQTYNITLSMCGKQLAELYEKDGQRVRLKLGFPEGYGPKDAGVTFKAYHYKDLGNGKYEIEEIPCTITEYGLIISVPAFSPFAIAALKKDETKDAANENVIFAKDVVTLRTTAGGKIVDAADDDNKQLSATVSVDGEKELIAVADDGYAIEKLTVNGDTIAEAAGKLRHNFTVKKGDSVVVSFVTTKKTEDIANPDTHKGYGPDEDLIDEDWEWPEEDNKDEENKPGDNKPSNPNNPTDPTDPTDPSDPKDPSDPTEPTDPEEPSIKQGSTQTAATGDNKASASAVFGKEVAGATGIKIESKSLNSFAEVSKKYSGLKAVYDIFAIDKDGQPLTGGVKDNDITVTLKIHKDVFGGKKYNTYKVVYIDDEGRTQEMTLVGEVSQDGEYYTITFKTTHLSYYGVVAYDEQKPTPTNPDKNNALTSTADGRVYIILAAVSLLGILALAVTKKSA